MKGDDGRWPGGEEKVRGVVTTSAGGGLKERGVDDRALEPIGRLARAAASAAPDGEAAQAGRRRFLLRLGERARGAPLFWFSLLMAGTAAATVALTIATTAPTGLGQGAARPGVDGVGAAAVLAGGTLVRFGDGSEIELAADGRGRLAEVAPLGARIVLEQGTLRVRVTPRPGTHFTIEAGPFRVQVKGTAFRVRWDRPAGRFELEMLEGTVHATGPHLAHDLHAGQHLTTTIDSPPTITRFVPPAALVPAAPGTIASAGSGTRAPAVSVPAPRPLQAGGRSLSVPSPRGSGNAATMDSVNGIRHTTAAALPRPSAPSWSRLLTAGELTLVLQQAADEGLPRAIQRRGLDDLAALATAARLSQRLDIARRAYRAQRLRFPGSGPAREAAFHLGRLADDSDHDPAGALAWYDHYLAESPGGAFVEEALGRKLAALGRLGDPGSLTTAAAAARGYLDRFPDGPHRDLARRLLDPR